MAEQTLWPLVGIVFRRPLSLVRSALDLAVRDRVIMENPATDLAWRKRKRPIRLTPTLEEFQAIVADARAQVYKRTAPRIRRLHRVLWPGRNRAGRGSSDSARPRRSGC